MLGIVLVAHSPLADTMKQVVEHIVGDLPDLCVVDVKPEDDAEQKRQEIADKVIQANEGEGVIVVTDIYGGVPSNLALSLKADQVRVMSGMNVPMLVKLVRMRDKGLDEAVKAAQDIGVEFILNSEKGE